MSTYNPRPAIWTATFTALAVLLAAGCTGSAGDPPAEGDPDPVPSVGSGDELAIRLEAPESPSSAAGFEVSISVENRSDSPLTLQFTSGQRFDLQAMSGGESLWTWSADRSFIQALGEETIPAGESLHYVVEVPAAAIPPGEVQLVASLTSSSHPRSATEGVEVEP